MNKENSWIHIDWKWLEVTAFKIHPCCILTLGGRGLRGLKAFYGYQNENLWSTKGHIHMSLVQIQFLLYFLSFSYLLFYNKLIYLTLPLKINITTKSNYKTMKAQ